MKEVIEKLVEIENKAQHIIDNAGNEKISIEREKKAEIEKFRADLEKKNEERIEQLRKKVSREIKPETEEVYKQGNEMLQIIETNFLNNRDQMAQEVFARIIGA